jgi:hypothetical protein
MSRAGKRESEESGYVLDNNERVFSCWSRWDVGTTKRDGRGGVWQLIQEAQRVHK